MEFDVNMMIGFIILLTIAIYGYSNIEHLTNEITYVKSSIDGRDYLVRNMEDKQEAANLLSKVRIKLEDICNSMKKKYPDDESVNRMITKFNPENITEAGKNNKYTSYSVNKGEKLVFCIRQKNKTEDLVDENTITFVAIHELAHIMTKSIGHEPEFWNNFRILLKEATALDIYKKEDYSKSPKPYCGITVSDSPLYNMTTT